ncbi:hypothetical protein H0X09_03365 [Candidatus Saccharibacteria bacterium]|nr:hypothetical protein [Candidatus Saccharibacteria bacterium]
MTMRNTFGGYTLIEVMIFLGVSVVMLFAAYVAVGGQQAHTEFTTSMNDVNTKLQKWADDVANGFTSGGGQYSCNVDPLSDYPVLSASSPVERGANPKCIFLGKAIQFNTQTDYSNQIFAYPMLGKRTYTPTTGALVNEETVVDSLENAKPIPAIFGSIDLTEAYKIPSGTRIISVQNNTAPTNSAVAGFFSSFNTEDSSRTNGATTLQAVQFQIDATVAPKSPALIDCLKLISPCTTTPAAMSEWKVCFGSTRNGDTAIVRITSTEGRGVATRLTFEPCV